ncbi:LLM class flavin-dependent oxidoreductase [Cellulomonas sp. ES6]|uniref:LLM class flavin-dependent oxidoreductase n=1 Tax=Cellulomonas sp. ES6 TaxID=3039384 RepID=UPI0024B70AE5|nr:LLM class flavin-dependent oxidoreductase [Cellulomonas sp. ES6]WHP16053.1 LLM class flavin-dependent oxidoreductase [Cellulomonas sp. ES6]
MRIGALLTDAADVVPAARAGLFGVLLGPAADGGADDAGSAAAAEVATTTRDTRVLVPVRLGTENPVTLAEEVAVLDHLSGGRVVAVVDPGDLDDTAAAEDVGLLRACWSGRPVRHRGARWSVPSGVMGPDMPTHVAVTPVPAQVDVPVWLTRAVPGTGLPVLATEPAAARADVQVQPGTADLTGDLEHDRALVTAWSAAGATHLLVRPPAPAGREASGAPGATFFGLYVARYLQPEVSMPGFPRIMAEADLPAAWTP